MALVLKYYYSFQDEWDRYHHVQILLEGFGGSATELTKVGNPPVVLTKPSDGNKFQPIQGKEIALKLLSTTNMQFSEFFTATNRDYLIRYWIENQTNKLTNGNFTNWTGAPPNDTPDNWNVSAAGDMTENPAGVCEIANTIGNTSSVKQTVLTEGTPYRVDVEIKAQSGGDLTVNGFDGTHQYLAIQVHSFIDIADASGKFGLETGVAETTIGVDNAVVHEFDKIFEGYLVPDMYYEPFLAPTYEVTLRATDGLGDLKNVLFESATDTPYTGQDDLLDIIEKCLDETGLALDIYSALNIFEDSQNTTAADDPLPQTYINQEVYRKDWKMGWNCYDVLVDIMTCFGAKLEQINGAWHIILIRDLAETSYTRRKYNSSGTYQSNDSESPQLTVSTHTAAEATLCAWMEGTQMLEIIPAFKEFTIIQDYGYRKNIVENPSWDRERWTDINTPKNWTKSAAGAWIYRFGDGAELHSQTPFANCNYISQSPTNAILQIAGSFTLYVKYKCSKNDAHGTGYVRVSVDTGAAQRYLDDDGSWNAGAVYLNFTGIGDRSVELESAAIPLDVATLEIRIYEIDDLGGGATGVVWDSFAIEIIPALGVEFPRENKIRTTVSTNFNYKPEDVNVNIGDLPGVNNEEVVYWGGLLSSTGAAFSNWEHKGAADGDSLLDHTAADIENNYDLPTHRLRGSIHSKVMDFNTVLKEDNLSNKLFIPGQMSYNPKRGLWTGEWLEIVAN